MEPLGHGAIRSLHLGDLREHSAFPVSLVRARAAARFRLLLLGALLHRGSFLVRESLGLLCAHRSLLCRFFRVLLRLARKVYLRLRALTSRFLIGLVTCLMAPLRVVLAGGVCRRTALPHLGRMPGRPAHETPSSSRTGAAIKPGTVHETSPNTSAATASRRNAAAGPIEYSRTRRWVMMAPTKNSMKPTAAAVPISGTPMRPTSSPSAPAALRVPSMGSHDSGTLVLAAVMRTNL